MKCSCSLCAWVMVNGGWWGQGTVNLTVVWINSNIIDVSAQHRNLAPLMFLLLNLSSISIIHHIILHFFARLFSLSCVRRKRRSTCYPWITWRLEMWKRALCPQSTSLPSSTQSRGQGSVHLSVCFYFSVTVWTCLHWSKLTNSSLCPPCVRTGTFIKISVR